jgi:hypothetical protein
VGTCSFFCILLAFLDLFVPHSKKWFSHTSGSLKTKDDDNYTSPCTPYFHAPYAIPM